MTFRFNYAFFRTCEEFVEYYQTPEMKTKGVHETVWNVLLHCDGWFAPTDWGMNSSFCDSG